jgi:hypothetical protein
MIAAFLAARVILLCQRAKLLCLLAWRGPCEISLAAKAVGAELFRRDYRHSDHHSLPVVSTASTMSAGK